ncbi:hypothetical protein CEUSTIGMA_g2245.t1 [Chlamydomonas eustigma]|uniref:SF4 helicase domain-containing protein n=1 Tax=Chlamydomonas eustigma TaxID=1157962 RepID=A0A250WVF0_9CHLO|nr:hypothetical protein CEUSTIGMA_g2245.t1 [Chlamydomonas eustigma]|eukprot:GAX74798.1 hypothetical protein CEUSTIGMA_g2245.t1 [Chlamydomonas eustigma]
MMYASIDIFSRLIQKLNNATNLNHKLRQCGGRFGVDLGRRSCGVHYGSIKTLVSIVKAISSASVPLKQAPRKPFLCRAQAAAQHVENQTSAPTSSTPPSVVDTQEALSAALRAARINVPAKKLYPGSKIRGACPYCQGGSMGESCLSLSVHENGKCVHAKCFRASCEFQGTTFYAPGSGRQRSTRTRSNLPFIKPEADNKVLQEEDILYFKRQGISLSALNACGVHRATGITLPNERDVPSNYVVMPHRKDGKLMGWLVMDLNETLQEASKCPEGVRLPSPKLRWLEGDAIMWGYDDAVAAVKALQGSDFVDGGSIFSPDYQKPDLRGSEGPSTHLPDKPSISLFLVEDAMDRLALVEAGVPCGQVLTLPHGIIRTFKKFCEAGEEQKEVHQQQGVARSKGKFSGAGGHEVQRRTGKFSIRDGDPNALSESEVFAFAHDSAELFGSFDQIILALHSDASSNVFASELVRLLGPERCSRLMWPKEADELHGSSPESAFHGSWLQGLGISQDLQGHAQAAGCELDDEAEDVADSDGEFSEEGEEEEGRDESFDLSPAAMSGRGGGSRNFVMASSIIVKNNSADVDERAEEVEEEDEGEDEEREGEGVQSRYEETSFQQNVEERFENPTEGSEGSSSRNYSMRMETEEVPGTSTTSTVDDGPAREFSGLRRCAHDMLLLDGAAALWHHVQNMTEAWPMSGLHCFSAFETEILELYDMTNPRTAAVPTGWSGLDQYYKVAPGELTIVTGVPNTGKSEWIDALAVNLAENHGWPIAFCSFEKVPRHHAGQLLEKVTGLSFFKKKDDQNGIQRMTLQELEGGLEFINEYFSVIRRDDDKSPDESFNCSSNGTNLAAEADGVDEQAEWRPSFMDIGSEEAAAAMAPKEEELPTIEWVIDRAVMAVKRLGIRGLVIDPYNELDHSRPTFMTETEYISGMLSKIKRFAQKYSVHVWLVAHPRQLVDWAGKAPSLYDISGSAHFINKADNGLVVHRSLEGGETMDAGRVKILVMKVRNKAAGKVGQHELIYERDNGRYKDANDID